MRFVLKVGLVLIVTGVLVFTAIARLDPALTADLRLRLPVAILGTNPSGAKDSLQASRAKASGNGRADVDELEREEQEIGALIRESQSRDRADAPRLAWPLPKNPEISSRFGLRQHPILDVQVLHAGIDIAAREGTPIEACAAGKAIVVTSFKAYGSVVVVDHGNRRATVYAHLSSTAVTEGQTVVQGQIIGAVGQTGRVTGPHLHLEVRENGDPVDPLADVHPPR